MVFRLMASLRLSMAFGMPTCSNCPALHLLDRHTVLRRSHGGKGLIPDLECTTANFGRLIRRYEPHTASDQGQH
jgi:hypothetical protein